MEARAPEDFRFGWLAKCAERGLSASEAIALADLIAGGGMTKEATLLRMFRAPNHGRLDAMRAARAQRGAGQVQNIEQAMREQHKRMVGGLNRPPSNLLPENTPLSTPGRTPWMHGEEPPWSSPYQAAQGMRGRSPFAGKDRNYQRLLAQARAGEPPSPGVNAGAQMDNQILGAAGRGQPDVPNANIGSLDDFGPPRPAPAPRQPVNKKLLAGGAAATATGGAAMVGGGAFGSGPQEAMGRLTMGQSPMGPPKPQTLKYTDQPSPPGPAAKPKPEGNSFDLAGMMKNPAAMGALLGGFGLPLVNRKNKRPVVSALAGAGLGYFGGSLYKQYGGQIGDKISGMFGGGGAATPPKVATASIKSLSKIALDLGGAVAIGALAPAAAITTGMYMGGDYAGRALGKAYHQDMTTDEAKLIEEIAQYRAARDRTLNRLMNRKTMERSGKERSYA
jgi:hypothetical protein